MKNASLDSSVTQVEDSTMTANPVHVHTLRHLGGFLTLASWTMTIRPHVTPAEKVTQGDVVRNVHQDMSATLCNPMANVFLLPAPFPSVITEELSIPSANHAIASPM